MCAAITGGVRGRHWKGSWQKPSWGESKDDDEKRRNKSNIFVSLICCSSGLQYTGHKLYKKIDIL